ARTLPPGRFIVADLGREAEVEQLAAAAGPIDILIANAAVPGSGELVTFSVEEIDRALNVNLRSAIVLADLVLPGMLSRGAGHIVLMSSIQGKIATALVSSTTRRSSACAVSDSPSARSCATAGSAFPSST